MVIGMYFLAWFTCFMVFMEIENVIAGECNKRRSLELGVLALFWPIVGFIYLIFRAMRMKSKNSHEGVDE